MDRRGEVTTPMVIGHNLTCLRWDRGQRFRALVPAGNSPRLLLQLAGSCLYRANGQRQEAGTGDILFDGGATACERQTDGGEPGAIEQIAVPVMLLRAPAEMQQVWQQRFGGIFPCSSAAANPVIYWLRQQLLTRPIAPTAAARLEAEARLRQAVLATLEPLWSPGALIRSLPEQRLEHLDALARARDSMAAHFTDDRYRLTQAADAAALSVAHFSQLFHRLTGLTAQEYLIRLRLEYAHELLSHSELSVLDICYESGFRHPSHFAAMFARTFGSAPSRWRQEQQAQGAPRLFSVALANLVVARAPSSAADRALPLYVRRGSALYLTYLALAQRATADRQAMDTLAPFLRRPERRNRAVKLIGAICEGAGEAGVEAIQRLFSAAPEAKDLAPLALGEALRGRPFEEAAATLKPYLFGSEVSPGAKRHAVHAMRVALRDRAEMRILEWTPQFLRTGDGLLDNLGIIALGFIFRGSAQQQVIAMLSSCLAEGLLRDVHDHTLSPACLCNSSLALALVSRGTQYAPQAADEIAPLLRSRDRATVYDGVASLCRLYTGQAPDGLPVLLPFIKENRFPPLLALFDGAAASRALPAIETLWSHRSLMLRRTLALALGLIYQGTGEARAREMLAHAIRKGSPKLRADALLALGLVDHACAEEPFLALAQESMREHLPYLTRSALLAVGLGFQGASPPQAVEWVADFTGHSNRYVASAAILSLGLLGQGTRDSDLAERILALSRSDRRLANDADEALLMLDFGVESLDLLSRWHGLLPCGEYASSFSLMRRCFTRLPGAHWDVDEPFWTP